MSKNALLSVYDKNGIESFAKELIELGWTIYASGGTAKALESANIAVQDVATLVGGGAILGHKVVTLSREIHAALLADYSDEESNELADLKIPRIDLVCIDLYPLSDEITKKDSTKESVIAQTDMGGPAALRSAAKGRRIVISKPAQRAEVLAWLKSGRESEELFLDNLAATAEAVVAGYALNSARYASKGIYDGEVSVRSAVCAYGENRWQKVAALYTNQPSDPLAISNFTQKIGSAPSYNNYCDIDRLLQTITHIAAGWDVNFKKVPSIAIGGKHGNACGAAIDEQPQIAIQKMLEGDLRAIFGGTVMVNFEIDAELAELLLLHKVEKGRRLLDVVVAPSVTDEALELLARKKDKCRVLVNPALATLSRTSLDQSVRTRYVRGGKLIQQNYNNVVALPDTSSNKSDLILGWAIGSTSNSNTITLVKESMLIGNGVGQQDRVGAAQLAIKRANDSGHDIAGASAYSDSFFPFADGPQSLADAGVVSILSTSGSVGDAKVADAMKAAGVELLMVPDSEARGFYAH